MYAPVGFVSYGGYGGIAGGTRSVQVRPPEGGHCAVQDILTERI